ncbi:MAG TPA: DUF2490 domain-containing protein [Salinimicrobium sp.]|nr:DUF2490 domain-containing protein [Salinimicrobium sp.]
MILIFFGSQKLFSQTPNNYLFEPVFEVNFSTEGPWSYSLGVSNRALLTKRVDGEEVSGYKNVHIEVSPFAKYETTENSAIQLGFRYRFREMYNEENQDRFKLVEEYKYTTPDSFLSLSHRGRMEQKFRREGTIFSFRYQLGISRPLGDEFSVGLSTEALYYISKHAKPDAEQRLSLEFSNSSLKNIELSAGIEYRLENYIHNRENTFFLNTGVSVDL